MTVTAASASSEIRWSGPTAHVASPSRRKGVVALQVRHFFRPPLPTNMPAVVYTSNGLRGNTAQAISPVLDAMRFSAAAARTMAPLTAAIVDPVGNEKTHEAQ